jgi:MFS family permease
MSVSSIIGFICEEIGIYTLFGAGLDVHLIIAIKMIRLIGFGATSLILALYLKEIGFQEDYIGLFMTFTFIGDLISSFLLSIAADRIGRRNILILSSTLMALTGLSFGLFDNKYILTAIATLGILTPSGGEVGPFRSIEQSSIASLISPKDRSDIYSWYTFLGSFCAALGAVTGGYLIDFTHYQKNYSLIASYKCIFLAYTVLSTISLLLCLFMTSKIEWESKTIIVESVENNTPQEPLHLESSCEQTEQQPTESSQLLPKSNSPDVRSKWENLLPVLDPSVLGLVAKLSLLFALDSFASSLVPLSWQSYYIKGKFDVSAGYLGSVFFITGIVSGFTSLLSTTLTKRFGPVVTMVVTHLPASILLGCVPIPRSFPITLAILVFRASTQSMDVAPKHVFLATLVPDSERTAVFGWVNVIKTLSQVLGPIFAGAFTQRGAQWITFVIASALKTSYDLGMLATFLTFNRHTQH